MTRRFYVHGDKNGRLHANFGNTGRDILADRGCYAFPQFYPILYELVPITEATLKRRVAAEAEKARDEENV